MKYAITGHTQGVGKRAYERLSPDIIGFSRSTGYDINDPVTRKKIVDLSYDCDVFINNAYSKYQQVELLYRLYEKNKDRKCTIINIGSASSDGNIDKIKPYAIEKLALEKACLQLQFNTNTCKVLLIKPGRMETPMVAHTNSKKINLSYMVSTIDWLIAQPENIAIRSITIDNF
jgi:NADP-dependent 3-hydroxy acid dehydrogenase YdfG